MTENRKLNILIVPDKTHPLQHSLLENIFGLELPAKGHAVTWLLRSADSNCYGQHLTLNDADMYLTPLVVHSGRIAQLRDLLYCKPKGMMEIFKIIRKRKIDLVQVRNDLQASLISLLACRMAGIPFVYYLAFPQQEAAAESARRGWTKSRYAARIGAKFTIPLRNWITRRADFVFTMSSYWRDQLIEESGLSPNRVKALPFGFDTKVSPNDIDGTEIRRKFRLEGHPLILYIGTVGPPRDVDILADIMTHLLQEKPQARLLILPERSQGRFIPRLRNVFASVGVLHSVTFATPVSHDQVPLYISAADVGLSPIEPIPVYNVSSPAKFVEMMGMGCAVVASDIPEQKDVIELCNGGICVPYEAQAFSEAIVCLLDNPEKAREMGKRGRKFVEEQRSFTHLASEVERKYIDLVHNIGN